jgi:hypothetical protein
MGTEWKQCGIDNGELHVSELGSEPLERLAEFIPASSICADAPKCIFVRILYTGLIISRRSQKSILKYADLD